MFVLSRLSTNEFTKTVLDSYEVLSCTKLPLRKVSSQSVNKAVKMLYNELHPVQYSRDAVKMMMMMMTVVRKL